MSSRGGQEGKPVQPGMMQRALYAVGAAASAFGAALGSSANVWFGPGQPMTPAIPPEAQPRKWEYQPGYNITSGPRTTEPISFAQLRALSRADEVLRLIIETRKDQIEKLDWSWRPKRQRGETRGQAQKRVDDSALEALEDFWEKPDGRTPWSKWLRQVLEEVFVIDAPAVYVERNLKGEPLRVRLMDGATLKPIIDQYGDIVGYQQWLYGVPGNVYIDDVDPKNGDVFTTDEVFVFPRNPSVSRLYGFSPVEQIIILTNIALRRMQAQLFHYTVGNIPEGFMQAPEGWDVQQIQEFQEKFDAYLSGNQAARSKMTFVPNGSAPIYSKLESLKTDEDEWWVRLKCYCFSVSPQPFIKMMNRATAQSAQDAALEEGLFPLIQYIETFVNTLTELTHGPEITDQYEFKSEFAKEVDPEAQSRIDASDVKVGIRSIDEVREARGLDPIGVGPGIITATGFVPLEPAPAIPEKAPEPVVPPMKLLPGGKGDGAANPEDPNAAKPVEDFSLKLAKRKFYANDGAQILDERLRRLETIAAAKAE